MFRTTIYLVAILLVVSYAAANTPSVNASSGIKGDWDATYNIAGQTLDGTFSFEVNGKTLTGSVFTEHTGEGTINDGTFDKNKLNCTLKFEKHESIALTGELADDKLSGTFTTEGMTGTWTALRKK
jgi:hypothetical protein